MITIERNVDMVPGGEPVIIHLSQYDDDFTIVFTLYSRHGGFTIASGTTAEIRGTKTDGNGFSADCTISGNMVTVTGDKQMTAVSGKQIFELCLFDNEKELNTANFILDVERAAMDMDTIESDSKIVEAYRITDRTDEIIAAANLAEASANSVAADKTIVEAARQEAVTAANSATATVQDFPDTVTAGKQEIQEFYEEKIEVIDQKAEQISRIATTADETAAQALSIATNAENHMASLDSKMNDIEAALQDVSIDPDDLGLEQDPDTYYVYPTYKGVRSENGIPLAGGGGGGGGGDVIDAKLTVENTTGWLSKTISAGSTVKVTFAWSSIEDDMPTGDGAVRITVNDVVRSTYQVAQGNIEVDLTPYIATGSNKVKVRISDTYDQGKTVTFNITAIALSISSSFDASAVYTSAITFPYTPVGAVNKTVYFIVDGRQIGTQETAVSGRQMSFTIPAQTHGAHSLSVYFEAVINEETVRSNELYYEFLFVDQLSTTPIITSSFHETELPQYTTVALPFLVYTPNSLTSEVTIKANGEIVSTQTVDRTEQSYAYKANDVGTLTFQIASGGVTKTISVNITESEIDVEAETQDLVLHLNAQGRSNREEHPDTWTYENIACEFSGFNFSSDGWQSDADSNTVLRVSGDARLVIPYKPFAADFRTSGKTIELEFSTRNVLNYDAVILSCMSGERGLSLTAQKAMLKSEQSEISTQYKEDEHVRIAFVVEKRAEHRLLFIYINGIASGVVQYPQDDDFAQTTPVNISVGSNDCTIDIYRIRIYDNDLTRNQVLNNWIADTPDGATMLERYIRNNVFDAYGNIVIANLPSDLPYMIISCAELPQSKGDKKICSGSFVNPLYPSKSFTFEDCQIDVQGTSSQYYARKNYKMKFNGGFVTPTGTQSKYAMNNDAIPVKTFTMKADYASSEGANNVELVRLYESACPYKTPAQEANSKVRQGIDGFPIVIFWNDTTTSTTTFIGKYNFNNDKSTEEVFGFESPDESWETLNNAGQYALWKSGDFSGDAWKSDFEARYPDTDPAYEDVTQLSEFATWAASTDTTAATGDALPSPVTYGETTYTNDTADYRLAKFKAEAGNYMEIDSMLFYYLFTELFLMVDSRAKNAFPSFIGEEVDEE